VQNGIEVELLSEAQLKSAEPNVAGVGAILSPTTGIVDYTQVAQAMAHRLAELGGEIRTGSKVTALEESADSITVHGAEASPIEARCVVVCGGLMADRLAAMMDIEIDEASTIGCRPIRAPLSGTLFTRCRSRDSRFSAST
jgi:L-2-hydroxyglutarate oxidase